MAVWSFPRVFKKKSDIARCFVAILLHEPCPPIIIVEQLLLMLRFCTHVSYRTISYIHSIMLYANCTLVFFFCLYVIFVRFCYRDRLRKSTSCKIVKLYTISQVGTLQILSIENVSCTNSFTPPRERCLAGRINQKRFVVNCTILRIKKIQYNSTIHGCFNTSDTHVLVFLSLRLTLFVLFFLQRSFTFILQAMDYNNSTGE